MFKRFTALILVIMLGGILVGCNQVSYANATLINSQKIVDKQKPATKTDALDSSYVNGLNEFAYNIFSELTDKENVFISPYSISMALAMIYNASEGTTRQEMAKLLGFDQLKDYTESYSEAANTYMNANSQYLSKSLTKADPKVKLSIANSIWLDQSKQFNETMKAGLLTPVRNYYNADIYKTDFTKKESIDSINEWVSDHTDKMIDPFLDQYKNPELLRVLLVNAIYFNGKWSQPFQPKDTLKMPFYGDTSTTNIDMMYQQEESYRYYSENGIRGIELPYGNKSIVMDVFIPEDDKNSNIRDEYGKLSNTEKNQFLGKLDQAPIEEINTLALPKFELKYGLVSLNDTLQKLGMKKAFDTTADFDLISDDLLIDNVGHMALIQVEEWGTKAAAATEIEMTTTSAVQDPLQFIVDMPFIFLIRDKTSGTILFMGEINQLD